MVRTDLPVEGIYLRGPNVGKTYTGFVATDEQGRLVAFPPGRTQTLSVAKVCSDAETLKNWLSYGWKTRVDVGDGRPASVLKAKPKW